MSIQETHQPQDHVPGHQHDHPDITIIVNGRPRKVTQETLSFADIVALAFSPVPSNALFTVTYSRGEHDQRGSLQPGQTVKVKDGMILNVTETGQS